MLLWKCYFISNQALDTEWINELHGTVKYCNDCEDGVSIFDCSILSFSQPLYRSPGNVQFLWIRFHITSSKCFNYTFVFVGVVFCHLSLYCAGNSRLCSQDNVYKNNVTFKKRSTLSLVSILISLVNNCDFLRLCICLLWVLEARFSCLRWFIQSNFRGREASN